MNFQEGHALETYKSMIAISVEGYKALLLINGGAIVATLAYLEQSSTGSETAKHMLWPLYGFVAGIVFIVIAFMFSYAAQFKLFNESVNSQPKGRHMCCVWAALFSVILSLIFFSFGSILSVRAIS